MQRSVKMRYTVLGIVFFILFLSGCTSKEDEKQTQNSVGTVEVSYQNAIKELILKGKNPAKSYQEVSWKKLQSSDKISERLKKRAVFIAHSFKEKNIYGGTISRENIYFIGDGKPSLIIDFDVKTAFEEFLGNKAIQAIFAPSIWNLESLHVKYQQSANDALAKEEVKDFIYSIKHFAKEDQDYLDHAISTANTPMSIAKNVALFMSMRLFPELVEELLFDEITYKGKYK